jgi:hypothetical protein
MENSGGVRGAVAIDWLLKLNKTSKPAQATREVDRRERGSCST